MKTTPFEHTTCSRCCGEGRYSFNLVHGSTCYGCAGKGYKLTAAGRAASARFTALMSVPAQELVPGQRIRLDMGLGTSWCTFEKFENGWLHARDRDGTVRHQCDPLTLVRVHQTAEQKQEKLAQALAYQDTLKPLGRTSP
jgi:hypothetical protein